MSTSHQERPSIGSLSNLKERVSSSKNILRLRASSLKHGSRVLIAGVIAFLGVESVGGVAASPSPVQSEGGGAGSATPTASPLIPGPPRRGGNERGDDYYLRMRMRPKLPPYTPTATELPSPSATNTPTRTATVTPTQTRAETATVTRTPESKSAPWPPEALYVLARIPVVDGLNYIRTTDLSRTGGAGSVYDPNTKSVIYLIGGPGYVEGDAAVYEIGHAHQHLKIITSGLQPDPGWWPTWLRTDEGLAFDAASQVSTNDHNNNGTPLPWDWWGINKIEDYSQIFMIWYTGYYPRSWFDGYPSLRDFGQVWLPDSPMATPTAQTAMQVDFVAHTTVFELPRNVPTSYVVFPRPDGAEEVMEIVKFREEFHPLLGRSGSMVVIAF